MFPFFYYYSFPAERPTVSSDDRSHSLILARFRIVSAVWPPFELNRGLPPASPPTPSMGRRPRGDCRFGRRATTTAVRSSALGLLRAHVGGCLSGARASPRPPPLRSARGRRGSSSLRDPIRGAVQAARRGPCAPSRGPGNRGSR
ncbi:hypothetical protein HPB48_016927 [Haemaphysalis longicornis]|uniref:Uncharacterized protein n=1 Tax=Haemaphysalis longicornis TaxID=44386 RepID=A0A9J6G472_HAELO|nr:hypothetical protein HPB48_016927 [Haemaphysalis longicornis]